MGFKRLQLKDGGWFDLDSAETTAKFGATRYYLTRKGNWIRLGFDDEGGGEIIKADDIVNELVEYGTRHGYEEVLSTLEELPESMVSVIQAEYDKKFPAEKEV